MTRAEVAVIVAAQDYAQAHGFKPDGHWASRAEGSLMRAVADLQSEHDGRAGPGAGRRAWHAHGGAGDDGRRAGLCGRCVVGDVMRESLAAAALGFAVGVALMGAVVMIFPPEKLAMRAEAIKNGAAYYACDQKTGDCVFTWGKP